MKRAAMVTWVASSVAVTGLVGVAVLAACQPDPPYVPAPSACPGSTDLWAASDYVSSAVGAVSAAGKTWFATSTLDLGADPALAISNGHAFYVARDLDTIFALDNGCGTPVAEFKVHQEGSNQSDPQDVAVASDGTMWVPLYLVPTLLVLAPDGGVAHSIDLSSYDGDGNPQAMGVAIVQTPAGEKAFVPLQRLNNETYASTQPSWMLRVDVPTAKVEATVVLAGRNPFGMTEDPDAGTLWLAEPGSFYDASEPLAGIERFDTTTSTTALVVHEAQLGGSVAEVAVSGSCGAAIVADPSMANVTSLATFDPTSGTAIATAADSPLTTGGADGGYDLEALTWQSAALLVGDRRRATDGYPVHAFRVGADCSLTLEPDVIFLPLPPVSVRAP